MYPEAIFKKLNQQGILSSDCVLGRGSKAKWLTVLSESLINRYKRTSSVSGWGYVDEPVGSWADFLLDFIVSVRSRIGGLLTEADHDLVMQLPNRIYGARNPDPYLLHGDCGVHNFIFESSRINGVIDPIPMIGPPLYDFIFAFCSSPDDLTLETLLEAADSLNPAIMQNIDQLRLIEEVLMLLYCRIGTCLKYHSQDLTMYRNAWSCWRKLREMRLTNPVSF